MNSQIIDFIISQYYLYESQIWWFSFAIICRACADYLNFQVPYDSGFWSLKTDGIWWNDAWHLFIVLMMLCFAIGMTYEFKGSVFDFIVIAGGLNSFWHGLVYHRILKKLRK